MKSQKTKQTNSDLLQPLEPSISKQDIEEIIVRFLINLPQEELQFPRLMLHIRDACYFYADNFFSFPKRVTNPFLESFAREVFKYWPYLSQRG